MTDKRRFQFLNLSEPLDYLHPKNRKIIRRNATLHRSRDRNVAPERSKHNDTTLAQVVPPVNATLQPFPIITHEYMYRLLEYTDSVVLPSLFRMKAMSRDHPVHKLTMSLALQDARVLNTQLAVASLWIAKSTNSNAHMIISLRHKLRAIRLVNEWLLSPCDSNIDAGITFSMMHLAGLEILQGNVEGWRNHLKALQRLAVSSSVQRYFGTALWAIIECELVGCYLFNQQPFFIANLELERPSNELGLFPLASLTTADKSTLLHLCSTTHSVFVVDEALVDCLLDLQELTGMASMDIPIPYPALHVHRFLTVRTTVEHKLFRLSVNSSPKNLSRTVCLAAQIYVNRVLRTFERGSVLVERYAEQLKYSLKTTLDSAGSLAIFPFCVVWIAAIGAIASHDEALRAWFVREFCSACYRMGILTWEFVHRQLRFFLWADERFENDAIVLEQGINEILLGQAC